MYMMNDREFSNRKETLHGEFYENALKYPERIALIYENEKVSYKMLRLYALRAANYMWQRGVRRNDKIVVILPRGIGQVELTFSTGRLCLVNTHGPVIWLPFLHMPRDEYGTLSINVEEEVNIPSGVTIGNVMLPSVKETFEQIWPDAVKKALEILFKQNRTEKMSMAQYQIYVSKLWSEICQKVGYMNIVDYDNFGDIKSIFYDLEKRHLIKKENDGIE